jgi:hypothetical protein
MKRACAYCQSNERVFLYQNDSSIYGLLDSALIPEVNLMVLTPVEGDSEKTPHALNQDQQLQLNSLVFTTEYGPKFPWHSSTISFTPCTDNTMLLSMPIRS